MMLITLRLVAIDFVYTHYTGSKVASENVKSDTPSALATAKACLDVVRVSKNTADLLTKFD